MSPTTQKFGWKDRDTAARDLLQLVYHAPDEIRKCALELLPAIRSSAIVPQLMDFVRDEEIWNKDRATVLNAMTVLEDDIYFPELRQHLPGKVHSSSAHTYLAKETVQFIKHHPSNRNWLEEIFDEHFAYIDTLSPAEQYSDLLWMNIIFREGDDLGFPAHDQLMRLLEDHPDFFDLSAVIDLHFRDNRATTQAWLAERWNTIIDLCISIGGMLTSSWSQEFLYLMRYWENLRQFLFTTYPQIIPQYDIYTNEIETRQIRNYPSLDVTKSPLWQEMAAYYAQAIEGDKKGRSRLSWGLVMSTNMLEKAVATHFYARVLERDPDNNWRLIDLLNEGAMGWRWSDQWLTQNVEDPDLNLLYTPAQFELGDVLRFHPSRRAWEALVNAYFFVASSHRPYFIDWIAYQTDRLSGLEVEYTGATLAVEDRPWFRALVEREKQTE